MSPLPEDEDFVSVEPLFVSAVELFDSDAALEEESLEPSLAAALSLPSLLPSTPEDLRA